MAAIITSNFVTQIVDNSNYNQIERMKVDAISLILEKMADDTLKEGYCHTCMKKDGFFGSWLICKHCMTPCGNYNDTKTSIIRETIVCVFENVALYDIFETHNRILLLDFVQ